MANLFSDGFLIEDFNDPVEIALATDMDINASIIKASTEATIDSDFDADSLINALESCGAIQFTSTKDDTVYFDEEYEYEIEPDAMDASYIREALVELSDLEDEQEDEIIDMVMNNDTQVIEDVDDIDFESLTESDLIGAENSKDVATPTETGERVEEDILNKDNVFDKYDDSLPLGEFDDIDLMYESFEIQEEGCKGSSCKEECKEGCSKTSKDECAGSSCKEGCKEGCSKSGKDECVGSSCKEGCDSCKEGEDCGGCDDDECDGDDIECDGDNDDDDVEFEDSLEAAAILSGDEEDILLAREFSISKAIRDKKIANKEVKIAKEKEKMQDLKAKKALEDEKKQAEKDLKQDKQNLKFEKEKAKINDKRNKINKEKKSVTAGSSTDDLEESTVMDMDELLDPFASSLY